MEAAEAAAEAGVRVGVGAGVTATSAREISARTEVVAAEGAEEVMNVVTFDTRHIYMLIFGYARALVLYSCMTCVMLRIMQSLMEWCWLTSMGQLSSLPG